jgi:hypothetical protein
MNPLHRVEQMIGEHEVAKVIHYKLFFEQGDVLSKFTIADSMAACAAAAAILVLFHRAVFSAIVFPFSLEIIGVAGGAEGRVLGPTIGNVFVIVGVAGATAQVAIVVTRIVADSWMRKVNRGPALRGMAVITFRDGNKMIIQALRRTANSRGAVVARRATIGNALVIKCAADEGCGGMAGRAIQAGRYMIR